jgi:ribosomal protein S18 acetylase RimI-like enzyme
VYINIVPAQNHMPDHYSDYLQGYRAVRLLEEDGTILGELVWRVASGHNIEIMEFGIFEEDNRWQGWGTRLLEAVFEDIRQYFLKINHRLWKVYLFCEEANESGRGFYESQGFQLETVLKRFYPDGDAVMYSKVLKV